ncbi:DUF5686 and carboxypeptidase regulatory-like domain-containing protein [Ferruginibacter lapsinanis]|uniref:DUF5686 family protein n=1 Tax=Ferruginibacter lapsinanis TaxID=563172 RepID=UPI001E5BD78B|nr:DUF5686 family protein [Ferruginibacter lapsinanis]UEG48913.1 DUF5686 and carboxypeptidase regulatory-like domain-containing protein [Ferruginibacter lapsinanis]
MLKIFTVVILLCSLHSSAQKIFGTVYNENGDLLPYASITIKGTSMGASANNRARFAIAVTPGTYTIVCQHVGYAAKSVTMTIDKEDKEAFFVLFEQKLTLKEVIIKNGGEDPAYDIIRQAIKRRKEYAGQVKGFTCDLYTKDMIKLRSLPKKIFGKKLPDQDKMDMMLDTMGQGIIYLSESVASVASHQPDKFKMQVRSSRVSGSNSFGFTFPAFISLYQNNVSVFSEKFNPRGFVSPIADGAIGFYKFKFLGSFFEDGKEINSIKVIPRRNYEPLFSGIINITEGDWRIHSFDLTLSKKSQLEIIDTLQITQIHLPVTTDVWRVKNQLLHFNFNQLGINAAGNFLSVYSDYVIDPTFKKGFFDAVVIKYDTGANRKNVTYWDSVRPVPLEREEVKDYLVKDSLFELRKDSALTKNSVDSLKRRQGALKPLQVFWTGIDRTHYSATNTYKWDIQPLIKNLQYNTVEGVVLSVDGYYDKNLKQSGARLLIKPSIRYGFNNTHLNAWVDVGVRTRDFDSDQKLKRQSWNFSGGKRVSQFNKESSVTPLVNTIGTLLYGKNYMKIYENWFGNVVFNKRFENGFKFSVNALYEDRLPIDNTTDFTFFKNDKIHLTPNYPYEKIGSQFIRHQALSVAVSVSIKPGQKYIQYPNTKIPLGAKYPTFSFSYIKGIKDILGSDVDYDKWKISIADDKNFKLAGLMKYKISIGGFLNSNVVFIQDYQHFIGNRSAAASEYVNSFQLAPYYANSTTASFYSLAHLEHHFNGMLTNKIPLFRKLNWNLVAGSNAFYVNNNNNYVEIFAGIENILKIFRLDFVTSYTNGKTGTSGIRLGLGGLLGANMKYSGSDKSLSIGF